MSKVTNQPKTLGNHTPRANTVFNNIFTDGCDFVQSQDELAVGEILPHDEKTIEHDIFTMLKHNPDLSYITTVGTDGSQYDYKEHARGIEDSIDTIGREQGEFNHHDFDDVHALHQVASQGFDPEPDTPITI